MTVTATLNLSRELLDKGDYSGSCQVLEEGLRSSPDSIALLVALAKAGTKAENAQMAEDAYRRAVAVDPMQCLAFGNWLQEMGRFNESEVFLRKALEIDPRSGLAYLALAEAAMLPVDEPGLLDRTSMLLHDPNVDAINRATIGFALGKALDQAKRYEEAARTFLEANEIAFGHHGVGKTFRPEITKHYPDKIAGIYSKSALIDLSSVGSSSDTPILIVGMIRSGTTLLDRIVSSQRSVSTAGELPFWRIAGDRFNRTWHVSGIDPTEMIRLQGPYLQMLARESEGTPRVIDKMPLNFELLGMIHLAFPKAKILHIRRNPADTCLSVFQNYYGVGANFAYNWDNIVVYYQAYLRFMELWRAIIPPESIFELDYKALVCDTERIVRSVIGFLGVPWEDSCLAFDAKAGRVETPSKWQARQPIYRDSIAKWRNYSPWFPHLNLLNELRIPPIENRQN